MAISPEVDAWLRGAGYQHHCFISWAHTINLEMTSCARELKSSIEQELALSIPTPSIFLDETGIPPGADWPEHLRQALCHSLMLVAVCVPIYYHPNHKWCGLEWATMDTLGQRRLEGQGFTAIVPLLFRRSETLPSAVEKLQYIDVSRQQIQRRRYYTTQEFRGVTLKIIERIEAVAKVFAERKVLPDCATFTFPTTSAFADYAVPHQAPPFQG